VINAVWISISHPAEQGFPIGGTRTPKGYEIEHQGVRRSLGHRAAYISLIEQYISQIFLGGTKNALTWQRGTSSKKGWEPLIQWFRQILNFRVRRQIRNQGDAAGLRPLQNPSPGKLCWAEFKIIGNSLKPGLLSENSSRPLVSKLVTGLLARHISRRISFARLNTFEMICLTSCT